MKNYSIKIANFSEIIDCGGQYDNRLDAMKEHHSCELESWVLHYMMKKYEHLNLCVYI